MSIPDTISGVSHQIAHPSLTNAAAHLILSTGVGPFCRKDSNAFLRSSVSFVLTFIMSCQIAVALCSDASLSDVVDDDEFSTQ